MSLGEIHELPLADRLACDAVREWLDRAKGTALAGASDESARKAIEDMRHLHLDNYDYTLVPKLLGALRRAGLLAATGTGDQA